MVSEKVSEKVAAPGRVKWPGALEGETTQISSEGSPWPCETKWPGPQGERRPSAKNEDYKTVSVCMYALARHTQRATVHDRRAFVICAPYAGRVRRAAAAARAGPGRWRRGGRRRLRGPLCLEIAESRPVLVATGNLRSRTLCTTALFCLPAPRPRARRAPPPTVCAHHSAALSPRSETKGETSSASGGHVVRLGSRD